MSKYVMLGGDLVKSTRLLRRVTMHDLMKSLLKSLKKNPHRTLMFRGINSVVKHFPWYDDKLLDPVRQQQLQDWGFNAVRLGILQVVQYVYMRNMFVCRF